MARPLRRAPRARSRDAHRGAVLRGVARRDGRRGHQDRATRHAATSCARSGPFVDGYSLFWAVEGRGRKSVTLDLRKPEGQDLFRRLAATADVVVENFRPARSSGGTSRRRSRPPPRRRAHLDVRPGRPARARPGPRPRRHRLRRAHAPHRLSRPAAGARRRDAVRLPHGRVRVQRRASPPCTSATPRGGDGAVVDAVPLRRGAAHPRMDARRLRPARRRALARGQPARQLGAPRQLPDRRRQVRLHRRRQRRELQPAVQGDGTHRAHRRRALRAPRRSRRAQRRDQRARRDMDDGRCPPRRSKPRASSTTSRWPPRTPRPTSSTTRTWPRAATSSPSTTLSSAPYASRRRSRASSARRPSRRPARRRSASHTREVLAERARSRRRASSTGSPPKASRDRRCSGVDGDGLVLRGGRSPSSGLYHFPLSDVCPYTGADDVEPVDLPRIRTVSGCGRRSRRRHPATRVRSRTGSASSSSTVSACESSAG